MLIVVAMNFCMALETHRYRVVYGIWSTFSAGHDMIDFDLYATKPMANTATTMALYEQ
jgi:hypothetical protein